VQKAGIGRAPAPTVWLVLVAAQAFALAMTGTVWAIFLVQDVGVGPLGLVLVGTVLEGTVLIFEVPTGVLADRVGRRPSIVLGIFVSGAGFLLYAIPWLPAVVAAQFVWGLGYTFISGADVAWITDEVGEEAARPLYLRAAQVAPIATLAGIGSAAALALVALWLPIMATGFVLLVLGVWLRFRMPETGFERSPSTSVRKRAMRDGLGRTLGELRRRPVLIALIGAVALLGAASEGFDRLWELHLLRTVGLPSAFQAVVWIALLKTVGLVVSIGAVEVLRRRADLSTGAGAGRALVIATAGLSVATVGVALAGSFWWLAAALWLGAAFRRAQTPALTSWVNQGLDPRTRAGVNSLIGQADAFGQVGGGPALGGVAAVRSVRAALVAAGIVQMPAAVIFALSAQRSKTPVSVPLATADSAIASSTSSVATPVSPSTASPNA